MSEKCNYPGCQIQAETTWAMIELCSVHRNMIRDETMEHYIGTTKLKYHEREHYLKIIKHIPFARDGVNK